MSERERDQKKGKRDPERASERREGGTADTKSLAPDATMMSISSGSWPLV
jgi:hypothetical protein